MMMMTHADKSMYSLCIGICCVVIGVVVVLLDLRANEFLCEFFNVDYTRDLEEFVVSK